VVSGVEEKRLANVITIVYTYCIIPSFPYESHHPHRQRS
jgi:hypothetical protein